MRMLPRRSWVEQKPTPLCRVGLSIYPVHTSECVLWKCFCRMNSFCSLKSLLFSFRCCSSGLWEWRWCPSELARLFQLSPTEQQRSSSSPWVPWSSVRNRFSTFFLFISQLILTSVFSHMDSAIIIAIYFPQWPAGSWFGHCRSFWNHKSLWHAGHCSWCMCIFSERTIQIVMHKLIRECLWLSFHSYR